MRKLNLEQITDTLNSEFKKEGRRRVFWYDEKQEFLSEIEELQLENAKLLVLHQGELFKTKILLERQEKETNYLILLHLNEVKTGKIILLIQ